MAITSSKPLRGPRTSTSSIGTTQTYAQIGYLKLNRDIDPSIEDLRDKEELLFETLKDRIAHGALSAEDIVRCAIEISDALDVAHAIDCRFLGGVTYSTLGWLADPVMQFEGDKIVHLTKIWHAGLAMKELGWV